MQALATLTKPQIKLGIIFHTCLRKFYSNRLHADKWGGLIAARAG